MFVWAVVHIILYHTRFAAFPASSSSSAKKKAYVRQMARAGSAPSARRRDVVLGATGQHEAVLLVITGHGSAVSVFGSPSIR